MLLSCCYPIKINNKFAKVRKKVITSIIPNFTINFLSVFCDKKEAKTNRKVIKVNKYKWLIISSDTFIIKSLKVS